MTSNASGRPPAATRALTTRQLRVLLVHTMLVQVLTFVLRPTASYQAIALDVPTMLLGVLGASFAVVPLILAVPTGHIVDRVGERRVMLAGAALLCGSAVTFVLLAESVVGLITATVLLGTGHLLSVLSEQALVAKAYGAGEFDTAFGRYTFAASVGQMLGPGLIVLFGGSARIPDTRHIFLAALGVATVLVVSTLTLAQPAGTRASEAEATGTALDLLRLPGLPRVLVTSCVVLAAVDISLVYLPALGQDRSIASGVIGGLLVLRAATSMLSRWFLGRLSAHMGRRRLLTVSLGLSAFGLAAVTVPQPLWLLALMVAAAGFGLGVGQPLTMSFLAESAPPAARGRAMALRLAGNRLGQVIIPSGLGLVAAGAGPAGVLLLTAVALAAVGGLSTRTA